VKLLVVSQYFWPENFRINDVAHSLSKKDIEVAVLTGKPNYPSGRIFEGYNRWALQCEKHGFLHLYRTPLWPRGRGGVGLVLNYLSFVVFGTLFGPWLLRGKKFDVIFALGLSPIFQVVPAILLGWLKGCPVIVWIQDLWPESLSATGYVRNRAILKVVEWGVRYIYRHVDLLLVQSEAFIEPVSALASGTPVVYYPNSVDENFAAPLPKEAPAVAGLDSAFPVLFAGNIGTAQAVEVIVEAATLLRMQPDIHFVVVGDGSRREWMLREKAGRNLANLHLPGRFSMEVMPGLMKKACVLLVTLADQEIFRRTIPSKVQAYLAAGRPILACLNGEGAKLLDRSGAGLTVPAENGSALAEAVLRLYRMPAKDRAEMGARGHSFFVQHFSHDVLMNQLIGFLSTVQAKEKTKAA
jgi:glycosyltransferase involved in cell wall biosynthesis